MRLALIGLGTVGQGFVEIIQAKAPELRQRYGADLKLAAVATRSKGTLMHPDGLDLAALLAAAQAGTLSAYPDTPGLQRDLSVFELIERCGAEALLEASVTDLQTGQPALDYCRTAFKAGMHVILANKGPAALDLPGLEKMARRAGLYLRFEGTVMAGTPSITLLREALAGCEILEIRGILNGTTNYILTQMERGMDYGAALAEAQALGYAEADPTADVGGWDAAGKLMILAAALSGRTMALDEIQVSGIEAIRAADVAQAHAQGQTIKLIAQLGPQSASVSAQRIPISDPLASVQGATNALSVRTDLLGEVTLIGPGAGRHETGFALLADVLALHRLR